MLTIGPTEDAWSRLALYQSRDVLQRRYQARHGGELSADKATEIIAHFEQGRQYFRSALSAGVLAGPLEQYYGGLAMARAMILYLTPSAREATLAKRHGLRATLHGNSPIEDIQLVVEEGTFREFLDATRNVESATVEAPGPQGYSVNAFPVIRFLQAPELGTRFSLYDLLSRIPGVRRQFEEAFGTTANCFSCTAWMLMATLNISVRRDRADLSSPEELAKQLRIDPRAQLGPNDAAEVRFIIPSGEGTSLHSLLPHVMDSLDGNEQTIIAPFREGWALSELGSYFAAMHSLSMLVRYHPTRWSRLLTHEKGDKVLPVLERLRSIIQTDFVRLALCELERPAPHVVAR